MNKIFIKVFALTVLLAQILLVSIKVNAASIGEIKDLERGELGYYCIQKWNGNRWIYLTYNQTFYTDTDGQRYIAYCLSPGNPGVGYVSGEKDTYPVKISEIYNNDIIWRILKNGYPNKSVEDLGVETADDAYFATMQAINSVLRGYTLEQAKELYCVGQFALNGENYDDIQRRGEKTLSALFNLIDLGLNGTETRNQYLKISINKTSDFQKENEEYYSQSFSITSSAEILNYQITEISDLPANSYIADLYGNKKEVFNSGEDFKIMIKKEDLVNDIKGNISIKAIQKNYPIYYGESQIYGYQDYALCNNSYAEVALNTEIYVPVDKSKISIVKKDEETKEPLQGVKFQIESTDGTLNTYLTDENGKIFIANQRPGIIKIKELETIENYELNEESISVELGYNEEKEIEITNKMKKEEIKEKEENEIEKKEQPEELKNEQNDENIQEKLPKTGSTWLSIISYTNVFILSLYGLIFYIKHV